MGLPTIYCRREKMTRIGIAGGTLYARTRRIMEGGTLLLEDGKIAAIPSNTAPRPRQWSSMGRSSTDGSSER